LNELSNKNLSLLRKLVQPLKHFYSVGNRPSPTLINGQNFITWNGKGSKLICEKYM